MTGKSFFLALKGIVVFPAFYQKAPQLSSKSKPSAKGTCSNYNVMFKLKRDRSESFRAHHYDLKAIYQACRGNLTLVRLPVGDYSLKHQLTISSAFLVLMLTAISIPIVAFVPSVKAAIEYDSGDPTAAEQLVLEYVNRARANPVAEGQRLGIDIHEGLSNPNLVGPRPPLAMNKILLGIAEAHTHDMYTLNYFSHNDPNGTTPFERMSHAGYSYLLAGEDMAGGVDQTAAELEDFMMIDSGTPGRPHRVNLLDLLNSYPCGSPPCVYTEIGIGYYGAGPTNGDGLNSLITEDFGATSVGPFLLGVVYNDVNGNNFYDIGEGIGGVTITTSDGGYYAVSSSSGGYAIPVSASGTITVTASGPGFGPITKTVTLNGANVKLDFTSQLSSQTIQSTSQTSLPSITLSQSTTQTSSQSTVNTSFGSIIFQSTPSSFSGATTPGLISACGSKFANAQSTTSCGNSFVAIANLPTPSTGWQFNHWTWLGGVTCSSDSTNPTTCNASSAGGSLTAVYAAQVTFLTNPASSALISWTSCSNPSIPNGNSFYSTSYGTSSVTACYVPYGYALLSWSCTGGVVCSGTANPTTVTIAGPGTITLNLEAQTTVTSLSSTSQTASLASATTILQNSSSSTITTTTYSTAEFGLDRIMVISMIFSVLLMVAARKKSLSHRR
ncbi:MAG: hypothetical protein ABSA92_10360 [Candidatus Bathyarchaeia archaeon]